VTIYYNGQFQTGSISSQLNTVLPGLTPSNIGKGSNGYTYSFTGLIDDVRVYNRALSAAQVAALYNGGK